MTIVLNGSEKVLAKIASENLFRALAGYHLRRTSCTTERTYWQSRLGIKEKPARKKRALAKPMTLAETSIVTVMAKATELTGVSLNQIYERDKKRDRVRVRKAICYALHLRHPELSLARIAEAVGRHDHTTACHALQTAARLYPRHDDFKALVDALVAA